MENTEQRGESYTVLELEGFKKNMKLSQRQFRELTSNEILIKVMSTTIHPADLAFLNGMYGSTKPDLFPVVPGTEGAGIIVQVAEGMDINLIGKRCALAADSTKPGKFEGLWAQYHYTTVDKVHIFNSAISFDKLCFATGNPLTAVGFLDVLRKQDTKSCVLTGAWSALGRMFARLCAKEGIQMIGTVRKAEYVDPLKSLGSAYVINTSNANWEKEFQEITASLNTKVCFDCVGGDLTGTVLALMPNETIMYHFGNLDTRRLCNISTSCFIFEKKVLKGFWLREWLQSLTKDELSAWLAYVSAEFENETDLFLTPVSKKFPLEEYQSAFGYYLTNMSEGKVIMNPNVN